MAGIKKQVHIYFLDQDIFAQLGGILTAHAVNNNQEIGFLIGNIHNLVLQRVPAPNCINPGIEPCRQTMGRSYNSIQALLIPCQFPIFPQRWHDHKPQIMRIGSEGLLMQWIGPFAGEIK